MDVETMDNNDILKKNCKERKAKIFSVIRQNKSTKDIEEERKIRSEKCNSKSIQYKDYPNLENEILIHHYGPQIYEYSRLLEGESFKNDYNKKDLKSDDITNFYSIESLNILKNHDIKSKIRTKLVDWLIEVLSTYKCETNTYYLTIHLLDSYLLKTKRKFTNSDIHLVGITCFFIASKFEDMWPLCMSVIIDRIAYNKFSAEDVKRLEKDILGTVDYKLVHCSVYDFIKNFIYDFSYNNKKTIRKLKFSNELQVLEETSIYISKFIFHTEEFSTLNPSLKAIACIILAFDLVRVNVPSFQGGIESFINDWIKFLVEQSRYSPEDIHSVYIRIKEFYTIYDKLPLLEFNLKKIFGLPF